MNNGSTIAVALENELFRNMFVKLTFDKDQLAVSDFLDEETGKPIHCVVQIQTDSITNFVETLPNTFNDLPVKYQAVDNFILYTSYTVLKTEVVNGLLEQTETRRRYNISIRFQGARF